MTLFVIGEWTALPLALPQPSIIANSTIRLESGMAGLDVIPTPLVCGRDPAYAGTRDKRRIYATRKHEAV